MWRFKDLNDWRRCMGTIEAAFSPAPGGWCLQRRRQVERDGRDV